jgi:hypothetical protein
MKTEPLLYDIDENRLRAIREKLEGALQPVVEFHLDHDAMTREALNNMRRDITAALALLPDAPKMATTGGELVAEMLQKVEQIGTPNDINVLMHYHCAPEPHPRLGCIAVGEAIDRLLRLDLIYQCGDDGRYRTTELGEKLVESLCNTPIPKKSAAEMMLGKMFER